MSGPQKPGPIAAPPGAQSANAAPSVVRASETRPNCSTPADRHTTSGVAGCPGLRNPAQLQRWMGVIAASSAAAGCPGLRNPAQLQLHRLAEEHGLDDELSGPQKPGPIAATGTRLVVRVWGGLSGPQKPGPIAATRRSGAYRETRAVVRASETRPNCSHVDRRVRAVPSFVVRASETRPNCSMESLAPTAVVIPRCPGLRNPAQLQRN